MTRDQMFGTSPKEVFSSSVTGRSGLVTLGFHVKPRSVPADDCGPEEHSCVLRELQTRPGWGYSLCPNHVAWYWSAR